MDVERDLFEAASILAALPVREIVVRMRVGETLEAIEAIDAAGEAEALSLIPKEIDPPTLEDAKLSEVAFD